MADELEMEALSTSTCLALLRTVDVGRLAVVTADGGVDIFPINFIVDHGTVVFRTAPGTKLDSLVADRRVAFEADHFDWYEHVAWSVVIKGDAEFVTRRSDLEELFDLDVHPWHPHHKPHLVRLLPTLVTGRRFVVDRRR
jgi:nitroimidazol reductase NimA-like FMN-containing flavoprotein (pyridoxamine 5'-phosphate oxidase superfamily)